jgi:hypothetical protein
MNTANRLGPHAPETQKVLDAGLHESVGPAHEERTSPARCAVSTGSLPGSAARDLIDLWEHLGNLHAASRRHGRDRYGLGYTKGLADAYTIAAEQLRLRLAVANPRQPEENTEVSRAP